MTRSNPYRSETQVSAAVKDALQKAGCMVWRQNVGMIPIAGKSGGFRRSTVRGMADLGGICPGGRALQVEVKRPGVKPSDAQADWLTDCERKGALCAVVRSVDDVLELLVYPAAHWTAQGTNNRWDLVQSPWQHQRASMFREGERV